MKSHLLTCLVWLSCLQVSSAAWTQMTRMPAYSRTIPNGFVINGMAYLGGGYDSTLVYHDDFWRYNPNNDSWSQVMNLPQTIGGSSCFTIRNKGYMINGWVNAMNSNGVYEYDPIGNTWTTKNVFPGGARYHSAEFVIGNTGYVGLGYSPMMNDFWSYDALTDSWTQLAFFPGSAREAPVSFAIQGIGYVGTGTDNSVTLSGLGDFYSYDPGTNSWTQLGNFGGPARHSAVSFVLKDKGYVGTGGNAGISGAFFSDFYEFDPVNLSWTLIDSIPADARATSIGFTVSDCGYIFGGAHFVSGVNKLFNELWRYCEPATGIDEYATHSIKIYFNPESQLIEVDCADYQIKNGILEVFDILGKCVLNTAVQNQQMEIPFEKNASGIYSYRLSASGKLIKSGKLGL